jgi:hypothetical protein
MALPYRHSYGNFKLIHEAALLAPVPWLQRPFLRHEQQTDSHCHRNPTVHRPPDLAGHEAARQDVDALKEPDTAKDDE